MPYILFAVLTYFSLSVHDVSAQTVARVGNKEITLKEFQEKFSEIKKRAVNPPSVDEFLEDLIRYEMGLQEAQRRKLENDPAVKQAMDQELYRGLVEKSIGQKVGQIKVNEKEMRAHYARNPEIRTSHILISLKPTANQQERAAAKKRAEEIYAEVTKSKRPFADLVKLYSDDTSSKNGGGDLDYQSRISLLTTFGPTYYEAALKMNINQIRGLVETPYGYHIIKLTGKRSYEQASKQQIRLAVFEEKRKKVFDDFFNSLKKNYKIETNRKLLSQTK